MTSEDRAGRSTALAPGGGFLLGPTPAGTAATPERLSGEQRAIREALAAFVEREIVPRREALEARDYAAHREVLARLGEAGFLGVEVPAEYGGAGLDRVTAVVVAEALGGTGSFTVTYGAHAGIGTLPLVFFGTDDQRRRYLPGLAAGTLVGAYALTEPGAGSDAMGIRTRATRLPDGRFRLDGAKQFITNAGFADLFTLYAKVDGEAFTAFLVERGDGGLTVGVEEEKMGIHGASTCPLSLDGVVVGPERVLGEVGQGHRVAFNILNVGRFKLAAACLGAMRPALATAVAYARERRAFGRAIADFGLVAAKLVGMATRIYAVESLVYRLAGLVDARLAAAEAEAAGAGAAGISQSGSGGTPAAGSETHQAETHQEDGRGAYRRALEEYAVECSIAKVFASEALNWVVDELVQVHGGAGLSGRSDQPDLGGDQRDQPPPGPGDPPPAGGLRTPRPPDRCQEGAGGDPGRVTPRRWWRLGWAAGGRPESPGRAPPGDPPPGRVGRHPLRDRPGRGAGSPGRSGRPGHRPLCRRERPAAGRAGP